ncbi:CRISPR-associated endonuclease Cas2 [Candidatus Arthromitus sp. SFB-rat-Yit]|uniref:CRISPR-associated endonuclease Cas2 n=1 Tax=Candidatus Arthromitus sp. SFB-rat-Yit TaxID=1041504 RepID=UPI000227A75F|nr:CRISPR-associated endonuclease Cas2 [Candidatus Arthromitus sp. SFB-rat-Yit]BAK81143.1 CRISPR-associated protein cas2 [Candidatus Arthromitus sp. SFB-rat-Yit]
MLILVTYDVKINFEDGEKRLRKVSKICENYGIRVQNSVFECVVDNMQFEMLKSEIGKVMDKEQDSVRYYNLGKSGRNKVIHVGSKNSIDVEDVIII